MINDKRINRQDHPSCGRDVVINGAVFRMDELLFQGADSRIFVAHALQDGGEPAFVVKYCRCRRGGERWNNAMREIEAGNMLRRCPHIVRLQGYSVVTDAEEANYAVYLLFNRLQCLADLPVTDTRSALTICRDVCLALECLRRKGLFHGDVKPQNIFYDGEKWLLGDLGSVCVSDEAPVYGSEGYLAPEAYRGEPCDIRADLYSLGITLYKILSGGRLPFSSASCQKTHENEMYSAIKRRLDGEEIPHLQGVSGEVNDLLLKMCRFDRAERYKKPSAVAKIAEKLLSVAF